MATAKLTRFIECGKIINTHGCHGDVKVEPWTDTPRDLIDLGRVFVGEGETKKEMKILRGSVMQGRFLMLSLEGVTDMNGALALRNAILHIDRKDADRAETERIEIPRLVFDYTTEESGNYTLLNLSYKIEILDEDAKTAKLESILKKYELI